MFLRNIKVRFTGVKRYDGNAEGICSQIVKDCWNGSYFQVSRNNYPLFYTRDFGLCCESLLKLGYKKEVEKTLDYALSSFKKKHVATSISTICYPFDFPYYAVDSLPMLLRALRISKNKQIAKEHYEFLNKEINLFFEKVIGRDGLVRKDRAFSSIRDHAVRKSSCYDNVMAALLSSEIRKLNLDNPLKGFNYKKLIKDNFWNKNYFKNDIENDYVCGDANIFPFWAGVFDDKNMMKKAFGAMQREGLDKPFPLKYSRKGIKQKMIKEEFFVPNWENNTVWGNLGMVYIKLLRSIDKKKADFHVRQYKELVENNGNFLEIFSEDGKPYSSVFYYSDEGLLWCSMLLDLLKY